MLQDIPWQEVIVGICVVAAAVFLLRRWVFPGKKAASCGGCGGCAKTSESSCVNPSEKTQH